MSIATELARCICAMRYEQLPAAAIQRAKASILDTVGVALAGSREDAVRRAARALVYGSGPSAFFGSSERLSPLDAALLNGIAAHALDYDDCSHTMGGHPSAPIVPALFALADHLGASGRDLITAYVTGIEVEARIASGVNFYHYTKGWHPTATLGVFGAAAACTRLLGLSEVQTAVALATAASFACGVKANFGTMMKPLHVGHCARNGLSAALLAREGYTANAASAFEHKQGFLNVFNGEGNYDVSKIVNGWAQPLEVVSGIDIKRYPCCGSTHPAIDAALILARKHNLNPGEVARIDSWIHERRLQHTNRPDPQSALDAKFSIQYCVARAVVNRKLVIEHFEGDSFRDAATQQLMKRVVAAPYTTEQFPPDNAYGAEIKVLLRDGSTYALKADDRDPLPPKLLEGKFVDCAARVMPESNAAQLCAMLRDLERINDVRKLTALTNTAA